MNIGQASFQMKDVSAEALIRSFVNYVTAHPAEMDAVDASWVLLEAWRSDGIVREKKEKEQR